MSKKERIEYLETQVAGLQDKLSEVIAELEVLKKQVGNAWLIPVTNPKPIDIPSVWPGNGTAYCFNCNQYYFPGVGHICSGPWKITWTCDTGAKRA